MIAIRGVPGTGIRLGSNPKNHTFVILIVMILLAFFGWHFAVSSFIIFLIIPSFRSKELFRTTCQSFVNF